MLSFGQFLKQYTKYKGGSRDNTIRARAKYNTALLRFGTKFDDLPDDIYGHISGFLSDADLRTSRLLSRSMNIAALGNLRKIIIDIPFHYSHRQAGNRIEYFQNDAEYRAFLQDMGRTAHEIERRISGGYRQVSDLMLLADVLSSRRFNKLDIVEILPSAEVSDAEAVTIFSALENNQTISIIDAKHPTFNINQVLEIRDLDTDPVRTFRSITIMPSLTYLDLSFGEHDITEASVATLAHCLYTNAPLQTLKCAQSGFYDQRVVQLVHGLYENTRLTHLDISLNHMGDVGGAALAEMLRVNNYLKVLEIKKCRIADSTRAIFEALLSNRHLTALDISLNSAVASGDVICTLIRQNTPLTSLKLRDCVVSNQMASNIALSLRDNSTLQELDLSNNGISPSTEQELRENKNNTLVTLLTATSSFAGFFDDDE